MEFGLDGITHTIDLSKKNAEMLDHYLNAGTRVGRAASMVVGPRGGSRTWMTTRIAASAPPLRPGSYRSGSRSNRRRPRPDRSPCPSSPPSPTPSATYCT
ncbi:hypothetical protein [Micromonospora pisi]|uniref:hypothetical protein n=1 Tax=Micromonospora pisi TaxID=589240 RepID=UPI003CCC6FA1